MKKRLLSALVASASIALASNTVFGEEAILYIEGVDPNDASVTINSELFFFNDAAIAEVDLEPGEYMGKVSVGNDEIGSVTFVVSQDQAVEVKLSYEGGQLISSATTYAEDEQVSGQLIGRVFANNGSSQVSGANVEIDGLGVSALTDTTGSYSVQVPRGTYTVTVSHPDYADRIISNVRIMGNIATEVSFNWVAPDVSSVMEEVLVFGVRGALTESSLAIERDSTSVIEAISAEDFKKFGDSSASDALKRVTGVSVVDGQFAVVRGMADRYISTTLDTGLLPSTDPFRRDVPLDLFPSGILKKIEISKSFSPDLPGDSTGGHVAMSLVDRPTEYVNELSISTGYNTNVTGKNVLTYEGGGRDWLGIDDGTREIPGVIDRGTNFGQEIFNECLPSLPTAGCTPSSEIRTWAASLPVSYETQETSASPEFGIGYLLGNIFNSSFGEIGLYGAIDYSQKRDNREESAIVENKTTTSGFILSDNESAIRSRFNVDLTSVFVAGVETDAGTELTSKTIMLRKTSDTVRFSDNEDLDDEKTFETTELQWVERQLISQQFSGRHLLNATGTQELNWLINVANSQRSEPDRRIYTYENGNLTASQVFRSFSELDEDSASFKIDYTLSDTELFGAYAKYQAGLFVFDKQREQKIARFGYSIRGNTIDRTEGVDTILSLENIENQLVKVNSQRDPSDKYEASESALAGYANAELDFDDQWVANVGLRYESIEQDIFFPNKDSEDPRDAETKLLPAVNLVWRPAETYQLRAAVSQTIARPGLTEIADTSFFNDDGEQIRGNPNLEISDITNIDFKFEYYWDDQQTASAGIFIKDMENPIEKTLLRGSGSAADGFTFDNVDSGEVLGLELDVLKNIYEGDSWLFTLQGNIAWVDSEVSLSRSAEDLEGRSSRQLQGQSEYLLNLRLGAEDVAGYHNINILFNYFDDRIDAVRNTSEGDRIEEGRTTVDLVYSTDLSDQLSLSVKAKNILDEDTVFYTSGEFERSEIIRPNGVSFKVGATYEF